MNLRRVTDALKPLQPHAGKGCVPSASRFAQWACDPRKTRRIPSQVEPSSPPLKVRKDEVAPSCGPLQRHANAPGCADSSTAAGICRNAPGPVPAACPSASRSCGFLPTSRTALLFRLVLPHPLANGSSGDLARFRFPLSGSNLLTRNLSWALHPAEKSPSRFFRPANSGGKVNGMSQIVRCDICGGIYNQSHLSSHKRLSHGPRAASASSPKSEPETLKAILSMYARLSEESKKEVLGRLKKDTQAKCRPASVRAR